MGGTDENARLVRNMKIGFVFAFGAMAVGGATLAISLTVTVTNGNIAKSAIIAFLVMMAVYYPAVVITARKLARRDRSK
jgi:uncharacterized membrane protein YhaH (DUF805 family)